MSIPGRLIRWWGGLPTWAKVLVFVPVAVLVILTAITVLRPGDSGGIEDTVAATGAVDSTATAATDAIETINATHKEDADAQAKITDAVVDAAGEPDGPGGSAFDLYRRTRR